LVRFNHLNLLMSNTLATCKGCDFPIRGALMIAGCVMIGFGVKLLAKALTQDKMSHKGALQRHLIEFTAALILSGATSLLVVFITGFEVNMSTVFTAFIWMLIPSVLDFYLSWIMPPSENRSSDL